MTDRVKLFESEPIPHVSGLLGLTAPAATDRVRAIIDLALIGAPFSGKSQFAAAVLRTLKARAPELDRQEAAGNRTVMRAVMGGSPMSGPRSDAIIPHYVFRVPIAGLLEMLSPLARIGVMLATGRLLYPIGTALLIATLSVVASVFLGPLAATALSAAGIAGLALLFVRNARAALARAEADGDIELVLWDPPGESYRPERAADTYDFLATLARRRAEFTPPWTSYAFVPSLVINPIDYGAAERRREVARLRGLLPMFAAIAGDKPRALVAINRWKLVSEACPIGSSKDETITVAAADRDGEASRYHLPRLAIASELVETEDGSEAGVDIRYLRYESAPDAIVRIANDAVEYEAEGGGGTLGGASQAALVRSLLELALGPNTYQPGSAIPARENEREFVPDEDDARETLLAMTHALQNER